MTDDSASGTPGETTGAADWRNSGADATERKAVANEVGDVHSGGSVVQSGSIGSVTINQQQGGPAPVRNRYLFEVQQIAPADLIGREAELAELAAFCTDPSTAGEYRWWQADAGAGKSALTATFVLDPPPDVRVVSFFVTSQSDWAAFADNVLEQLLSIVDEHPSSTMTAKTKRSQLLGLLHDAAETCRSRGESLVLVVDGLDRDRGITTGPHAQSIAGLLPARLPAGVRVVVTGRPDARVPDDVHPEHPLRQQKIVRSWRPTPRGTPDVGAETGQCDLLVLYVPPDEKWAAWVAAQIEDRMRLAGRRPRLLVRDASTHEPVAAAQFVVILTPEFQASAGHDIAQWAPDDPEDLPRRIVQVQVKACPPDLPPGPTHFIDLVGRNAASAADTLLAGISSALAGEAELVVGAAAGAPFPDSPVFVGEPPTVPPKWFKDRHAAIDDIEQHLGDVKTSIVMVVGAAPNGKTAMIHQLWERVRVGESPLHVHGLVYLSARGFWPVNADHFINQLIQVFPPDETEQVEIALRRQRFPVEKLVVLLDALAGRNVIVAIDSVEELVAGEDIADPALRELVDHIASSGGHGLRLLLVGRRVPDAVAQRFRDTTHDRDLDDGLPKDEAFALLQAMDAEDRLKLRDVPEHDQARLYAMTGGSPRLLELAHGVLAGGDHSFKDLLDLMGHQDDGDVVVRLLDSACEQLSLPQRRVLQALAVYGRPVEAAAIDHLVGSAVPGLDSRAVLGQLRQLRLAQSSGTRFSVPANEEREYLIGLVQRDAAAGTSDAPEALLRRAADYFAGQRMPEPQCVAHLRAHLVEIELRLRAGDREEAFDLMGAVDDRYLWGWGASSALEHSLRVLAGSERISTKLDIDVRSMLARALMAEEDHQAAAAELLRALDLAAGAGRANRRIMLRGQLTEAYLQLGELRRATQHSRRACSAAVLQWRGRFAMTTVADLAMCLARQGKFETGLRLYRVARRMWVWLHTTADEVHVPALLLGEAWIHSQLGDRSRAGDLLREARNQARRLGERVQEGECLLSEAQLALDDHDLDHAVVLAEQASDIGVSNGNRPLCRVAMEILAQVRLDQDDLEGAMHAAKYAQRSRGSVIGHALVGLVAYRQHDDKEARAAFRKGCADAERTFQERKTDFQFLDLYGLVTCGLALLGETSNRTTSLNAYRAARRNASGTGAVDRTVLLLKQFEPRVGRKVLDPFYLAAKGEPSGHV